MGDSAHRTRCPLCGTLGHSRLTCPLSAPRNCSNFRTSVSDSVHILQWRNAQLVKQRTAACIVLQKNWRRVLGRRLTMTIAAARRTCLDRVMCTLFVVLVLLLRMLDRLRWHRIDGLRSAAACLSAARQGPAALRLLDAAAALRSTLLPFAEPASCQGIRHICAERPNSSNWQQACDAVFLSGPGEYVVCCLTSASTGRIILQQSSLLE
mmetsp:Transcript_79771/g.182745  ORF Transcript_79771/g.182745 Transcript_79771/m.182745 type:complete len:209 (-) Transcript_79771:1623-2249(-)